MGDTLPEEVVLLCVGLLHAALVLKRERFSVELSEKRRQAKLAKTLL